MQKILIMGLPGSGKTTLAREMLTYMRTVFREHCTVNWYNADEVRKKHNDWDFSYEGRIRQSKRMADLAENSKCDYAIVDFVCPLSEMRHNFKADWVIWMDTIDQGRFEDTNKMFVNPDIYDFRVTEMNAKKWAEFIIDRIVDNVRRPVFDWRKETVQMLGRWQPWHEGHRALFERAISKTGQVMIQIRDCQGWNNSNPFNIEQVEYNIRRDLDPFYQGMYDIQIVPNIVNITYGRDVGYKIEQEVFDEAIHAISATKIRKQMGVE